MQGRGQAGVQTDVFIMDFSKPFDKLGHQRLIKKLNLLQAFLANRTQQVVVKGKWLKCNLVSLKGLYWVHVPMHIPDKIGIE